MIKTVSLEVFDPIKISSPPKILSNALVAV
jgi:hypothetical protein